MTTLKRAIGRKEKQKVTDTEADNSIKAETIEDWKQKDIGIQTR